jgi:NAD(P)H-hydrate epimerase
MKILSSPQIKDLDKYTIDNEPISSLDLMERAARKMVETFINDYQSTSWHKYIFCGPGNNGGDGLAIARMLSEDGHLVKVYLIPGERSADCQTNLERLVNSGKVDIETLQDIRQLPEFNSTDVIIDAIYGSGLNKVLNGLTEQLIIKLNQSKGIKISIDIPSGLFADHHTEGLAFEADRVYTFQLPKLAFLLPENSRYVKRFKVLDIRLSADFINQIHSNHFFLEKKDVQVLFHPRQKFDHKGTFGHALIIAGSYGKMGAAILSAKAALKSGCGLVSAHIPSCGYSAFQSAFPEAMCSTDSYEFSWSKAIKHADGFDAVGIGPGIGTESHTLSALAKTLKHLKKPVILDADAINLLAKHPDIWKYIPENSILTPHPGEFKRLVGDWKNDFDRLEKQKKLSITKKIIIILKGAHSSISDPEGNIYFNSTGNSGMATAGSGDVLTGILTGLLAQGYGSLPTALLAVYLHGLAGNYALDEQSKESLIASDIIDNLGKAFKFIRL